jgi:hypothetical protein
MIWFPALYDEQLNFTLEIDLAVDGIHPHQDLYQ